MKLWLKIVIIVLVLALVGGGIVGIVKLADSDKLDNKTISTLAFSVGGLDGAGKYKNTDQSIYTKNAFECQGLNCSLAFDNEISYQIYFYDQNNEFVHTTGKLTGAFVKDSVPFFAKYARIVITPNEDNKVSRLEVNKYAKQLKVTVYREQGFKNYTENLFDFKYNGYLIDESGDLATNDPEHSSYSQVATCEFVNLSSYKECLYFKAAPNSTWALGCVLHFYDANKNQVLTCRVSDAATESFVSSEGITYLKLDNCPDSNVVYVRMYWQNGAPYPELHCR